MARTLEQLFKLADSELTPEEKILKYGTNPPRKIMYCTADLNGKRVVLEHEFAEGEEIPEGFKDSPAAFGAETQPQQKKLDPSVLKIAAVLGDSPAEAPAEPPAEPPAG